jgi:hypothetical protein
MKHPTRPYKKVLEDYLALGESSLDGNWNQELAEELFRLGGNKPHGNNEISRLSQASRLATMTDMQLVLLVRAATIMSNLDSEHPQGCRSFSCSCVSTFYFELASRTRDYDPELTEWVLANRINPYDPMGSFFGDEQVRAFLDEGVCSMSEYYRRRENAQKAALQQRNLAAKTARTLRSLINSVANGDLLAVKHHIGTGLVDPYSVETELGSLLDLALANDREGVADYLRSLGLGN